MFVNTTDDAWRFDIPLYGADPRHVTLDVTGNTMCVRVDAPESRREGYVGRYEQTLAVPPCLDLGRLRTSHQEGLLTVTVPRKEAAAVDLTAA